ncbi:MAG TPA: GNAT family N-acetyltransferase [Methylibium sp.]
MYKHQVDIQFTSPTTPTALAAVRELMREYARSLDVDLCFQDFERELAGLPGDYAPPGGLLLLAHVDGELAGCGAFRPLANSEHLAACEMKRLYLRPDFRGLQLGRRLAQALVQRAREAGYASMLLDTLSDMKAARGLYAELGFRPVPPYYDNPLPGVLYMKLDLGPAVAT